MSEYPNFLNIRFKVWWIIFFCIQAFIVLLMVASFGADSWVRTENDAVALNLAWDDSENNFYEGDSFVGRLFACKDSCDESYGRLTVEWCDYYHDIDDAFNSDYVSDPYRSVCLLFYSLYLGMGFFFIFEIAAITSVCFWASGMICYMKKVNCICLAYCCSGTTWALHYIAFLGYLGLTRTNFTGDCEDFPEDGTSPRLCAGDGPNMMLFLVIFIPFFCIFFCVVACNLQRKYGHGGFDKKPNQDVEIELPNGLAGFQGGINAEGIVYQNNIPVYSNVPTVAMIPGYVANPPYYKNSGSNFNSGIPQVAYHGPK